MLIFSGWIPDTEVFTGTNVNIKTGSGRVMLFIVLLDVLINFVIVGRVLVVQSFRAWRTYQTRKLTLKLFDLQAKRLKEKLIRGFTLNI